MFSLPKISVPSFLRLGGGNYLKASIPSVEIHDIETSAEKRPRTLKHLLKANHANYSIIYHDLRFHNHTPHFLGSAYVLGGTAEHLNEIYEREAEGLEPWRDSPGEISREDWRDFLGKREYQRAFIDFFEDQLVSTRYNLEELLEEYLFGGKEPLINGLVAGLAHPLIHLGYAYELESKTVAIEALALGACFYNPLHKYIDDPSYTKPHKGDGANADLYNLLNNVRHDARFNGLYSSPSGDITKIFEQCEEALLEHWNAWPITDPTSQFEQAQALAAVLVLEKDETGKFSFFFVHALTSSHAIRVLLPLVPAKFHVGLIRQWWLFTLAVYVAQMRPVVKKASGEQYDVKDKTWKHVVHNALEGPHSKDAHYVKTLRSLKTCAETWGDENKNYLAAAVKFADEFDGWGGFGAEEEDVGLAYPTKQ
ncbi:hypothetical protein HBH98_048540 [Parastagonospora nodorum]|nr:hypothetical protein HBH98_048540 [Parastagonospora nodorum]KAH4380224.1 hypothetical protein HBH97_093320 [Parastagonospora nodorum]KAH4424895.1 hypothetical protein HBH99_036130 [Parastagonospora nodorum]KAH5768093.1 hypothetical protein HBI16_139020 [Parastagonospora nodorum]KAH6496820.1 hypothetical protein HBI55_090940 [Parastagonospora nodorum]